MSGGIGIALAERGFVPLPVLRRGVRSMLAARREELSAGSASERRARQTALIERLGNEPIALATARANEQHYELPPEFFGLVLGARRKYSGCLFREPGTTLDEAELAMLELYLERAELRDGMDLLELGCGWGSLTLLLAERFPSSRIVAVSNSQPQRSYIESELVRRSFSNVEVITADMNDFAPLRQFDRVLSIEMFEHMRNYARLLERISGWLKEDGRLFLHIFCHREYAYAFDVGESGDWMARHFFTGGLMPSQSLLRNFDRHMKTEEQWSVSGGHYARTARAWRENLERRRSEVMPVLRLVYGAAATTWYQRWRLFFLSCEELFAFRDGQEWFVTHLRLRKRRGL
ncbi:MAG: cyclopropane-fatty-acyl-phospholipid synthase family protein [Thermoanaerobaculia bacterium]